MPGVGRHRSPKSSSRSNPARRLKVEPICPVFKVGDSIGPPAVSEDKYVRACGAGDCVVPAATFQPIVGRIAPDSVVTCAAGGVLYDRAISDCDIFAYRFPAINRSDGAEGAGRQIESYRQRCLTGIKNVMAARVPDCGDIGVNRANGIGVAASTTLSGAI